MAKSSRFSIEATISMIDKMSAPMGKAARNAVGFSKKISREFAKADSSAKRLNAGINKIGGRTAKRGMMGLSIGAGLVTRQFVQFDDAIFAATAKFSDLDITTKKGQKTMEQLRKTARGVGADTKFNAVEAAQGLDFLAMAGFNTEQAMAALPGVTKLATVANLDLATSTDIASDTLGAFNLTTEDSVQLQKNLARVTDVSAKTTTMFNTTLQGLFEAVKSGGPTFTAAGQSIESFSTLVGVMANAGVKGDQSGTALRNVMLRLSDPTAKAAGVIKNLGVEIQDSQGNFRDVIDILGDFEKSTKGMGTAQKTAALSTVFGARAVTGINILLAEGSDKLKGYRDTLLASGGAAEEMAKIIEQSAGNKIKALGSAATELGFKILEAFSKDGKDGIDSLTKSIREFNVKPIVDTLKVMFTIIGAVFSAIQPFVPLIFTVIAAIKLWAFYQAALNFVMTANPIGVMIVAIAALVIGITALVQNWEAVKESLEDTAFGFALVKVLQIIGGAIDEVITKLQVLDKFLSGDFAGAGKLSLTTGVTGAALQAEAASRGITTEQLIQEKEDGATDESSFFNPFASPVSQAISSNTTNTTRGTLDINVAAQKGTTATQSGNLPPEFTLNTGVDN